MWHNILLFAVSVHLHWYTTDMVDRNQKAVGNTSVIITFFCSLWYPLPYAATPPSSLKTTKPGRMIYRKWSKAITQSQSLSLDDDIEITNNYSVNYWTDRLVNTNDYNIQKPVGPTHSVVKICKSYLSPSGYRRCWHTKYAWYRTSSSIERYGGPKGPFHLAFLQSCVLHKVAFLQTYNILSILCFCKLAQRFFSALLLSPGYLM